MSKVAWESTHETKGVERVVLVSVQFPLESDESFEQSLAEMVRLLETLGGQIVGTVVQKRHSPDPAYYVGKGKAFEIGETVLAHQATLVAFDNELSGSQQKNLERVFECRVIDRTGVILDIFSRHARTKEAKDQVEVATLHYLASRLTRRWTHLERQKGGIGLRGLGEKQIELDRRLIKERMSRLKGELKHTARERSVQRRHRDRFLRVALVGYTNAGKSTLMNRLTASEVLVDDQLFATLDSTVRVIDPKTRPPILLSDTVGFIRKLPHSLVASFRSTLAEVLEADLLLQVVDVSSPSALEQLEVTQTVLEEIGAGEKPFFVVFNKADLLNDFILPKILLKKFQHSFVVSAHSNEDIKKLRNEVYDFFEKDMLEIEVLIPYRENLLQSKIYECSKVLEKKYQEEGTLMKVRMMRADAERLKLESYRVVGSDREDVTF